MPSYEEYVKRRREGASCLHAEGIEQNSVLRVGQNTVSIEHHGDGPQWRILSDGTMDPIYPYYSMRDINDLSDEQIEEITSQVYNHLHSRRSELEKSPHCPVCESTTHPTINEGDIPVRECNRCGHQEPMKETL